MTWVNLISIDILISARVDCEQKRNRMDFFSASFVTAEEGTILDLHFAADFPYTIVAQLLPIYNKSTNDIEYEAPLLLY